MRSHHDRLQKETHNFYKGTTITLLAGAAIGAAAAGVAHEYGTKAVNGSPEMKQSELVVYEAEQIANKYKKCTISGIQDLHNAPSTWSAGEESRRTTLLVTVSVERNPNAAESLKKYDQRKGIQWLAPEITANVTDENGEFMPVESPLGGYRLHDTDIVKDHVNVDAVEETLQPIQINPLPGKADGAIMTFEITTNAMLPVADIPEGQSATITKKYDCSGKAIWHEASHSWELAPPN